MLQTHACKLFTGCLYAVHGVHVTSGTQPLHDVWCLDKTVDSTINAYSCFMCNIGCFELTNIHGSKKICHPGKEILIL